MSFVNEASAVTALVHRVGGCGSWMSDDVSLDGQRELRTLANGMRRDRAAIQAALTTTYTSGAVEGNVTRIKLLKRQMYGRANFDLLRRRILLSP
nr:transposase [Streptomyces sp. NBC_00683]